MGYHVQHAAQATHTVQMFLQRVGPTTGPQLLRLGVFSSDSFSSRILLLLGGKI